MPNQTTRTPVLPCNTKEAGAALDHAHRHLGLEHPSPSEKRTKRVAHVPRALVEELVTESVLHGEIFPNTFDGQRVREQLSRLDKLETLLPMAEAFARNVRDAIREERAAVGEEALVAYAMLKGITRAPQGACLIQGLERMQRIMKRRRSGGASCKR